MNINMNVVYFEIKHITRIGLIYILICMEVKNNKMLFLTQIVEFRVTIVLWYLTVYKSQNNYVVLSK